MSGIPFRGVSSGQDNRFTDKERKLLKSMKFPKEYSLKIDVAKVNWEIMKEWTAQRVTQLLGVEDEVLIGYIHEQLGPDKKDLDPKKLQIGLTGFLEKNTSLFVKELWTLLASASEQASGIPKKILDDKAEELRIKNEAQKAIQERLDQEKAKKEAARREAADKAKAEGKDKVGKDRPTENGSGSRGKPDRAREGRDANRSLPDRELDRDRPAGRSDRPDRDSDRAREYDRRRGASPGRRDRSTRDFEDRGARGYDRDRGYDRGSLRNRGPDRDRALDRDRGLARDRGLDRRPDIGRSGVGRDRSPVLKRARYGRSRSPGRQSPGRDRSTRKREGSRSPGRGAEGKRDLKDLHSTFAKAEAETVLPDKAEHLILPPQRVDTAFPAPAAAARDEADDDMLDVDAAEASPEGADQKHKKDKKQKKDRKEKKKHKKDKKEKKGKHRGDGSSGDEDGDTKEEQQRIEDELREKALLSVRRRESSVD